MPLSLDSVTVLGALRDRETATGLVSVGDLIEATKLGPDVVVNELERLLRGRYVTGRLQRLLSGGDPRPWFVVNPLLSDRGAEVLRETPIGTRSAAPRGEDFDRTRHWDAFISHAHEDKASFVHGLAEELSGRGLSIWYDDDVLEVGDSVRRAIDEGLRNSEFGVVVISRDFMNKDWTNRELDGILALEHGPKRLLPIWHGVERTDVEKYSPTVAGRFAVRSAIGVEAVADALCRSMGRGRMATRTTTPTGVPTAGPVFLSQLGQPANSCIYSWVVIGPEVEEDTAFTDDQIETVIGWVGSLEPRAAVRQATSSFIWATLLDESGSDALWSADVRPGPVLTLMSSLEVREINPQTGHSLRLEALVGWWARVIAAVPQLAANLGLDRVRIGLALNPYASGSIRVVDVDFGAAPLPARRAEPHQISPWRIHLGLVDPFSPPPDLLNDALRDFLDKFSYGRVEPLQRWVADGLASGRLGSLYPGPAGQGKAPGRAGAVSDPIPLVSGDPELTTALTIEESTRPIDASVPPIGHFLGWAVQNDGPHAVTGLTAGCGGWQWHASAAEPWEQRPIAAIPLTFQYPVATDHLAAGGSAYLPFVICDHRPPGGAVQGFPGWGVRVPGPANLEPGEWRFEVTIDADGYREYKRAACFKWEREDASSAHFSGVGE